MKSITIIKAMNNIDDAFIEEAILGRKIRSRKNVMHYFPAIAGLAAAAVIGLIFVMNRSTVTPGPDAQVVNPFVYYDTLAEASQSAGFDISVPDEINGARLSDIAVIDGTILDICYGDEAQYNVRKGAGNEDISGDYEEYTTVLTVSACGKEVLIKGNGDMYYVAIWTDGGYTYSFSAAEGLSEEEMMEIIGEIR